GPFAAYLGNGGVWGDDYPQISRVLYSPDGEHWGMCWATGQGNVTGNLLAFCRDGAGQRRIALGCAGSPALGARSLGQPAWSAQRPLAIGCGGTNYLVPEVVVNGTEGSNSAVGADPAAFGAPPPPCNGPVFRCTRPDDGRTDDPFQMMGAWPLTRKVSAG